MNTIFEAVKAITGGITAINGQLIKGSGYAISAGGKVGFIVRRLAFFIRIFNEFSLFKMRTQLVSASGDAVSNVGKKLALSAKLIEPSPSKSHFAKFASLSSGLSSSSSSSGHHSGHTGHETSAHGESEYNICS